MMDTGRAGFHVPVLLSDVTHLFLSTDVTDGGPGGGAGGGANNRDHAFGQDLTH